VRRADLSGEKNVALAVLWQAVKDAKDQGSPSPAERVNGVVFLASSRATAWFDIADIEQVVALSRLRWPEYAKTLLGDDEVKWDAEQRQVVEQVLEVFGWKE
jgi:hypothetical protein